MRHKLSRKLPLGEGQARTTMLVAQQAYVAAVAEERTEIDRATVEVGLDQAMNADVAAHQAAVEQIRVMRRRALDVAVRIASGDPPYGSGRPNTAKRNTSNLELQSWYSRGRAEDRATEARGLSAVAGPDRSGSADRHVPA